jgi:hypothetical protein
MARYAEDMTVDKKDQLEKIEGVCLPNETIRAVFDLKGGGSGFIGLTNKRLIYYDKAFLKKNRLRGQRGQQRFLHQERLPGQ